VALDTIVLQEKNIKKYIIIAIDINSKIAIARMYQQLNSINTVNLLERMEIALGIKIKAVNTDNGSEFLVNFEKFCRDNKVIHFFIYPRSPKMNAVAERFNRTIQEEANLPDFYESSIIWNKYIAKYIMDYNFSRPHYSLDYKTPVDVLLQKSKKSNMSWTHTTT